MSAESPSVTRKRAFLNHAEMWMAFRPFRPELLGLRAGRGMDCRVLTAGILDPERETSLDEMLRVLSVGF